ncbi:MAG: tetratricopeptide repeat protein, partial [Chitinophagaceae bacterium]
MTRITFLALLLLIGGLINLSAQSIPALSFEIKKPQKLENKKLGSERGADKKFTATRRFFQNTITKFNWHFNANEKLNEIIARAKESHKDDYTKLLSFYNYSPAETVRDSSELDSVIYKANAGILLHDLRNDWVDNLYMLMGRAYYFRQVFDTAYLNFQYINYAFSPKEKDGYDKTIGSNSNEGGNAFSISTKETAKFPKKLLSPPPSRNESFIWLIRTYLALEEYPEAAGMIETLKSDPAFPERLQSSLYEMQSLWFYQQDNYDSASFYLEKALVNAPTKEEKARWEYLLAQLYEKSGKKEMAKESFDKASDHTLNPILEVYARLNSIRQNKSTDDKAIQQNIDDLLKMVRKDRYTNYRDIIYYSIAQMELERKNMAGAKFYLLKSTKAAIDKSADPNQKSRSFLLLGDLSYNEANYSDAKNYYDSVQNQEIVEDQKLFINRKEVLTRIASSENIIYRQDSLQRIASLPEAERDALIKKLVKKLRKAQGLKEDEPVAGVNPLVTNTTPTDLFDNTAKGDWYFSNTSLKSKGYTEFKSKWGSRPNADNWRRLSAVNQAIQKKQADNSNKQDNNGQATDDASEDISFDGLLKKLPLTA